MTLQPPLPTSRYRDDERARAMYSEGAGIYRIVPRGVALPGSVEELVALVRWAGEVAIPLVPRGAGSAVTGSNVGDGIVVDLTRMAPRILEVDAAAGRARTSAGVRAAELETATAPHRLRLPPDPSSSRFATLGGMVSTNASGARTVRYGSVRRWVLGLDMVTVDGDLVTLRRGESPPLVPPIERFQREVAPEIRAAAEHVRAHFPRTRKNSSGYALDAWLESGDLVDLVIGAEGTLGIVTQVEWRLDAAPSVKAGLRIALADLGLLAEAVEALLPLNPSALELLDRTFLDLVRATRPDAAPAGTESILLLEFEGTDDQTVRGTVGDAVRRMKHLALDISTGGTPEDETRLWEVRHAASPIIADLPGGQRSLQVIEDGCVPVSRMAEYIVLVRGEAARLGLPVVIFGHAGDGNIHVNVLPDVDLPGWESDVAELYDGVTRGLIALGGTTSGEHSDGRIRAGALRRLYGHEVVDLFQRVKEAFDPSWLLNPGVKLPPPHPTDPLHHLKVGADAAPIPADIELALREIEKRGDYTRDRLAIADSKA
ncbi:MAG: FAD-binding oxidoreductase [Gemmatimonadota bacterium]